MFKRATWLGVGFTLGVGTTVVAARKARQQLDRYKPPALVDRVTTTISTKTTTFKDQVVVALSEGRSAAKAREEELREPTRPRLDRSPSSSSHQHSSPTPRRPVKAKVKVKGGSRRKSETRRRARRAAERRTVGPVGGDPARRATPRNEACRGSDE